MCRYAKMVTLIIILPWVLAPKCIEYDPVYSESKDLGINQVGEAGESFGGTFIPATPCPNGGEVILDVGDYYFAIICGCLEATWEDLIIGGSKRCTVPVGTTVKWRFMGSEEHNVASDTSGFQSSSDLLAGGYEWVFNTPGVFAYSCTLHSEMEGYVIDVREND